MPGTRNPNSVRRVRVFVGTAAICAFVVVDIALVTAAMSSNPSAPSTAAAYTPSLSSAPTPSRTVEAEPLDRATRTISAFDSNTAWRADIGDCPVSDAVIERSSNGGQSWNGFDLGTQGGLSGPLTLLAGADSSSAHTIALDKDTCAPTWVGTTTEGSQWAAYPDRLGDDWYVDPTDPSIVRGPGGTASAPCELAVSVAGTDTSSAAALCSDGAIVRTNDAGATWQSSTPFDGGVLALGSGSNGYLFAATSTDPSCIGLVVGYLPQQASTTASRLSRCAETGNISREVAISGNQQAIWLWSGSSVRRSTDVGATWQ